MPHRAALTGILFVLRTGIPWEDLPGALGCGCGMTCGRRLRDGQAAGGWDKVGHPFLDTLEHAEAIDWSAAVIDRGSVRALFGGQDRSEPHGSRPEWLETSSDR